MGIGKVSKKQRNSVNGWLIINKPVGIGSTKVVSIIKRFYNAKKVGHAGTLDPLAQGVLPIALGEATKTINFSMDAEKEYRFTVKWGEATSTDDAEGEVVATSEKTPTEKEIKDILDRFKGKIEQTPPAYSAIKIDGKRAYDLARAGENVVIKSRKVTIFDIKLLESSFSAGERFSIFQVTCSKGTYVRSLARDMAEKLGTKGHVIELIRTKVGNFCIEDAILLDVFDNKVYKDGDLELLLAVDEVLDDIPVLHINSDDERAIRQGKKISLVGSDLKNNLMVALKSDDLLVALGVFEEGFVKPSRVFNL